MSSEKMVYRDVPLSLRNALVAIQRCNNVLSYGELKPVAAIPPVGIELAISKSYTICEQQC